MAQAVTPINMAQAMSPIHRAQAVTPSPSTSQYNAPHGSCFSLQPLDHTRPSSCLATHNKAPLPADETCLPTATALTNSPIIPGNIRLLDERPRKILKKKSIWRLSVSILIIAANVCMYAVAYSHLHHSLPCTILRCLHFIPSADTVSTIRGQSA